MNNFGRNLTIWLIIGVVLLVLVNIMQDGMQKSGYEQLAFSDFLNEVESGQIADVTIKESVELGTVITGHHTGGSAFMVQAPTYPELIPDLRAKGVKIVAVPATSGMDNFWSG